MSGFKIRAFARLLATTAGTRFLPFDAARLDEAVRHGHIDIGRVVNTKRSNLTRATLPVVLDVTLDRCRQELVVAKQHLMNYQLVKDLEMAVQALELIDNELHGSRQRPKGLRSGMFLRYSLDEPRVVMDRELQNFVSEIEHIHKRF